MARRAAKAKRAVEAESSGALPGGPGSGVLPREPEEKPDFEIHIADSRQDMGPGRSGHFLCGDAPPPASERRAIVAPLDHRAFCGRCVERRRGLPLGTQVQTVMVRGARL